MGYLLAELKTGQYTLPILDRLSHHVVSLRLMVVLSGFVLTVLHFHTPLKYKYSILLASPLLFAWLHSELRQFGSNVFWRRLEQLGQGSYSIYLIHMLSLSIALRLWQAQSLNVSILMEWFIAASLSLAFFLAIERPSHRLAKGLAKLSFR